MSIGCHPISTTCHVPADYSAVPPDAQLLCSIHRLVIIKLLSSHFCAQAALHPTPAVCGHPRGAAKDVLASQEIFDRGFYSGPFGWLSGSAAEFVVAIRSALIHADREMPLGSLQTRHHDSSQANGNGSNGGSVKGNGNATAAAMHTISLYAGVGIVKGSTPEAEWQVSHLLPFSIA